MNLGSYRPTQVHVPTAGRVAAVVPFQALLAAEDVRPEKVPGPTKRFDSGIWNCRWDTIRIARHGPDDTPAESPLLEVGLRYEVYTFASNIDHDPDCRCDLPGEELDGAAQGNPWILAGVLIGADEDEAEPDEGLLLVQDGRGRYLWVRTRPELPAEFTIAAAGPRNSLLDYLPAVYRESSDAAAFLERFLAVFAVEWQRVDDWFRRLPAWLDPKTVPAEAIDWLAGWFDIALEPEWTLPAKQRYLGQALALRQCRGTARAAQELLVAWIEAWGVPPRHAASVRIIEGFRLARGLTLDRQDRAALEYALLARDPFAGVVRIDAGTRLDGVWRLASDPEPDARRRLAVTLGSQVHVLVPRRTLKLLFKHLQDAGVERRSDHVRRHLDRHLDSLVPAHLQRVYRVLPTDAVLDGDDVLGLRTFLRGRGESP